MNGRKRLLRFLLLCKKGQINLDYRLFTYIFATKKHLKTSYQVYNTPAHYRKNSNYNHYEKNGFLSFIFRSYLYVDTCALGLQK